jgi:hypothetical protein
MKTEDDAAESPPEGGQITTMVAQSRGVVLAHVAARLKHRRGLRWVIGIGIAATLFGSGVGVGAAVAAQPTPKLIPRAAITIDCYQSSSATAPFQTFAATTPMPSQQELMMDVATGKVTEATPAGLCSAAVAAANELGRFNAQLQHTQSLYECGLKKSAGGCDVPTPITTPSPVPSAWAECSVARAEIAMVGLTTETADQACARLGFTSVTPH